MKGRCNYEEERVPEELAAKCESASAEELWGYISMTRFNAVNGENKPLKAAFAEALPQPADLRKSSGGSGALKKQIAKAADHRSDNQQKDVKFFRGR